METIKLQKKQSLTLKSPRIAELTHYYSELYNLAMGNKDYFANVPKEYAKSLISDVPFYDVVVAPLGRCLNHIQRFREWGDDYPILLTNTISRAADKKHGVTLSPDVIIALFYLLGDEQRKDIAAELRCSKQKSDAILSCIESGDYSRLEDSLSEDELNDLSYLLDEYVLGDEAFEGFLRYPFEFGEGFFDLSLTLEHYFSTSLPEAIRAQHKRHESITDEVVLRQDYGDYRRYIEIVWDKLTSRERDVINTILDRPEGQAFSTEYLEAKRSCLTGASKNDFGPLLLPDDFFTNDKYIDTSIEIIDVLRDVIIAGGPRRFSLMIDFLASEQFGYIEPSLDNKRLLASILTGRHLATTATEVSWIMKYDRKKSKTEKVILWLCQVLFGGGYENAYARFKIRRTVKPGAEAANTKYADKVFQKTIEQLYRPKRIDSRP